MASFWLDPSTQTRYTVGRPFTGADGTQYTKKGATPETFKALGFQEVTIDERPDDRYYIVSGPDDYGHYTATPRDHVELVASLIAQENQTANSLLASSDWMVIRQVETGTPVPPEYLAYRHDVRNVCGQRQALEMSTHSTQELEKLMKTPATLIDTMSGKSMGTNPAPHLEPWPMDPEEVRRQAKAAK